MSKQSLTRILPRPAMIVAVLALVVALGGTATAAQKLINGKSIKPGTITSKQIKNRSIGLVDIKKGTAKKLRGAKGERGPAGPKGAPGPQGEAGPAGVINPLSAVGGSQNIPLGGEEKLASVIVPTAGNYIIQAKTNLYAFAVNVDVECRVSTGAGDLDNARWSTPDASSRTVVPLMAVGEVGAGQEIALYCGFEGSNGSASNSKLIAIPVA